jgi:hypothetical protein
MTLHVRIGWSRRGGMPRPRRAQCRCPPTDTGVRRPGDGWHIRGVSSMSADIAGLALNTKRAGSATLRDRPGPARNTTEMLAHYTLNTR